MKKKNNKKKQQNHIVEKLKQTYQTETCSRQGHDLYYLVQISVNSFKMIVCDCDVESCYFTYAQMTCCLDFGLSKMLCNFIRIFSVSTW